MKTIVPQFVDEMIHRMHERARISLQTIDCFAMQRRQRRPAISLQQLTNADDYIQRSAQFVAYSLQRVWHRGIMR